MNALDTVAIQSAVSAPRLKPGAGADKARAVAMEFEAVFVADALKTMWQGVSTDPLTGGGTGSETWRDMLADRYADRFVARGGLGLAEPIARELLKIQEESAA
ncbi:rod-binding protein [Chthonobacter rhizosphaerae]|uniref:rod-binding protein n=1 Tax=Chthonobacter rhizosphaerae TaxID=2735553 RepID=UPI0015EEDA20|nr:rod-binding protein [Chthonobacter rhizosphaerae]